MRQLWSIVVCLALVLGLGLSEVPRLCHGDGHGGACAMATCQCEGACTCKLDHEHERVAADVEAASVCEGGTMSADRRQALARLAASCHTGGQGPRFAPPQKPWTANLPPVILGWHVPAQRPDVPGYRERASLRAIAPPLRPPSLLA